MKLENYLKVLKKDSSVAIFSDGEPFYQILINLLAYYIQFRKQQHLVCIDIKYSTHDITEALQKKVPVKGVFFIDAISLFKDYALPYHDFDLISSPDLVNDIWVSANIQVNKEEGNESNVVVVMDNVVSLLEHMDLNQMIMFMNPFVRQIREKGASIILITGLRSDDPMKNYFESLVEEVIEL